MPKACPYKVVKTYADCLAPVFQLSRNKQECGEMKGYLRSTGHANPFSFLTSSASRPPR